MATLTAMPTPTAQLSPPPASNAFARKAGFVDVTFGPRRITFSEPVPPHPPCSPSSYDPRPLGVRMREIHAHGPARVRRWVDAGDERPLAPFVDQQVHEIIVAIWAPDKTGGWKHYFRAIPISKAYKTDRKDGLALAVVVEFTQLCPEYLKYRLVALNRISGNAYWAELGHA
uniref:Serine/threonine-protein kinase SMU1 (EC) n=1 Tax=Ganoderma boninense TaxID=34458 RepID=A0A5K1K2H8_9APHY|nr:Serine/threonine-protein kinase SMU1 (EC [Ganoderma boninense]